MAITKKLKKEIADFCKKNSPEFYWDYNDTLDTENIKIILEKGIDVFEDIIYENNIDYSIELEEYFYKNTLLPKFEDKLVKKGLSSEDIEEVLRSHIYIDYNIEELLKRTKDIICTIPVFSNYDCTNSFDTMKSSDYLRQVFRRVKRGEITVDDFMWEHRNGAYGGCVFMFLFRCDLLELLKLREQITTGKRIRIPKGTQYGFYSDTQGAGSVFEKETTKDFLLNIRETGKGYYPEFDHVELESEYEQWYSIRSTYGVTSDFAKKQKIKIYGQKHNTQ